LKKLIPPFLRRIDTYLLLNYPVAWISKIHVVLFYGLITWTLSALSGLIIPINLSETQDLGLWYFLFTILAIVALCFWIYHNIIFNLEKKYGKRRWTDEYKVFFLNIACVFIFISFPMPFTAIYNSRVAATVSDAELIHDINLMNAGEAFVANNLNNYASNYDTISNENYFDLRTPVIFDSYTPWTMRYDTLRYPGLHSNYATARIFAQVKTDPKQLRQLLKNYKNVWKKYGISDYTAISEDSIIARWKVLQTYSPMKNEVFYNFHGSFFDTYALERSFDRISEAKYRTLFILKNEFLHFILYTCFYLSLLVMLFKMVPWKQFLLTMITGIILPILLFIVSQLLPRFDYSSRDLTYIVLMMAVVFVALVFTGLGFSASRQFNPFRNICAQISYLVLPLLPAILMLLAKAIFFRPQYYENYNAMISPEAMPYATNGGSQAYNSWPFIYEQLMADYWRDWFEKWTLVALYGGLVVFILLFMPLMKHLFVKQLALPHRS